MPRSIDMLNQIDKDVAQLKTYLVDLAAHKEALTENAEAVKDYIQSSFETHMSLLKAKEKQLLRQVDVITAHQKSLLDKTIVKVHDSKGSLIAITHFLEHYGWEESYVLNNFERIRINSSMQVSPSINKVSVVFDSNSLKFAIANFGKVLCPDSLTHQVSSVIPDKMEEYGDSDNFILHKSLGAFSNVSGSDSPLKIRVRFPKILVDDGWLATPKKGSPLANDDEKYSDVATELSGSPIPELNKNALLESEDDDGFQFLDNCKEKDGSERSSIGSSIEVVEGFESEKDFCVVPDFNQPTTPYTSEALIERLNALQELHDKVNRNYPNQEVSKELAPENTKYTPSWVDESKLEYHPDMEIIKKKTLISPFEIFSGKHGSPPTEGCGKIYEQMLGIVDSDSKDWLAKSTKKIRKCSTINYACKKILYNPPPMVWLAKDKSAHPSPPRNITSRVHFAPCHNNWLLRVSPDSKKGNVSAIHFEKTVNKEVEKKNSSIVVSDLKGALAELAVMVPQFKGVSMDRSEDEIRNSSKRWIDCDNNLSWLSTSSLSAPFPGLINVISSTPASVPNYFLSLEEQNLSKWLIKNL